MQQIVRSAGKGDGGQVVMVLTHLTATQPQLTELPKSVLKVRAHCRQSWGTNNVQIWLNVHLTSPLVDFWRRHRRGDQRVSARETKTRLQAV